MHSDIKKGALRERCVLFGNQQSDRNSMKMRKLFVEPFEHSDIGNMPKNVSNNMKIILQFIL